MNPLLDEDGSDWNAENWFDFLQKPNLCYRDGENSLLFWGSPNDDEPRFVVNYTKSEAALRGHGNRWGWHVNGEFVFMDDPFWLFDLTCDDPLLGGLAIGGFLYDGGEY